MVTAEEFDLAAQQTDPNPTPAQAEAENYRTGKIEWRGLILSIENREGTERKGVDRNGKPWSVTMPAHYGRILGTVGADADHVDFYMGEDTFSERVFVVDQRDAETGKWDEHKVMLGFSNQQRAKQAFLAGFSDGKGKDRWGGVTSVSVDKFLELIQDPEVWKKPMRDDPQWSMPGLDVAAEPAPEKSGMTDRQRAELAARQQQSKMRRLDGNTGNSGPLFDDQGDIFASTPEPEKPAAKFPATLQDIARRPREGEGRLNHIYAEFGGARYYLASVPGNPEGPMNAWLESLPDGPRIISTDRYDGTSINGTEKELRAAIKAKATPDSFDRFNAAKAMGDPAEWWARASRENEGQEARDVLERAGVGFDRIGRPWRDIRPNDQNAILDAREELAGSKAKNQPSKPQQPPKKALKGLTKAENDQLAALEAQFLDKFKGQTSSGLDPELVSIALKIGNLYVRAGRRRFRDLIQTMMERMGLPLERAQPYARNAYNQIRDDMDLLGEDVSDMDTSQDVMAEIRKMRAEESRKAAQADTVDDAEAEGGADVSDTSANLEPSSGPEPSDGLGAASVPAAAAPDRSGVGGQRAGTSGAGRGPVSGELLPANDAASLGTRGDSAAGAGAPDAGAGPAQRGDRGRSDNDGQQGQNSDGAGQASAESASGNRADLKARLEAQKAADRRNAPIVLADPKNIAETLPLLFESQHEDVLKAEARFQKPDGHGMMFTNGTGTGKTFTGLGVVKRFALQGKGNILIVAPTQGIMSDWMKSAQALGLSINALENTQDAGRGIVITT
ncbi:MAG: DEAD/DEAH box helicase family protein, partial [Hyphomonas sp.]|nr:DEAD/DEAH box helicase family protein [Hyphomonas sp.]